MATSLDPAEQREKIKELLLALRDDKSEHVVDLSHGQCSDEDMKRIAMFVPRNISMEALLIPHNKLGSAAAISLASALATRHSHLRELDASNNSFRAEGLTALSEALEWNVSVEVLNLRRNELSNDGETVEAIVALGRALEKNAGLTSLDLSDNNLTDFLGKMEGIAAIAAALSRNQLLKSLNLSCNVIGAQGAAIMSDCIVSNASLTSIDLSDNHFGSEGCKSIASILSRGSFTAIRTLDLSHNSLCGKYGNTDESAVIALAGAVRGHETLTDLNLVDNQVTVAAGQAFVEALRFNTSLTQLQLGGGDPVVGNEDVMRGIDLCTGSNALIREIVDGVKDIDDTDSKRRTALHHAVLAQSVAGIEKLIDDLDADRNVLDARRYTPLREAVGMRYAPTIAALLSREVDINLPDRFGDSPLHQAVRDGDGALATVLLDQGASTKILNNRGLRPLDVTRSQHLRELLLKHAARRAVWLICGHDDLELEFGKRLARELWERSGLLTWLGGGEGRDGENRTGPGEWQTFSSKTEESGESKNKGARGGHGMTGGSNGGRAGRQVIQQFAGYEGPPGQLMDDMIGHCAVAVYVSGPYANRSPACRRELVVAAEKKVPLFTANYSSGMMPRSIEKFLYKTPAYNFSAVTSALSRSRQEAAWQSLMPDFVDKMNEYEDTFRREIPMKMIPMIGKDADHFALKQVDGKCFVFVSHGGTHREYATQVRHELEQYRLWCFVDNNDKQSSKEDIERANEGLQKCMVFCPILSVESMKNGTFVGQILRAEKEGKPIFPIVLSLMKIPPTLHTPCTLLLRRSIASHIHPKVEGQFSGIGPVSFRGNFESLAVSIQSQIAMGELYGTAGVHTGEGVAHGENFGGVAKSGGRYRQLQDRIRGQEAALVEAHAKVKKLERELELSQKKQRFSANVVKELGACVEYYRSRLPRYEEVPESSVDPDEFVREVPPPAVQIQRVARGWMVRKQLHHERMISAAILCQRKFRGYRVRKEMWLI